MKLYIIGSNHSQIRSNYLKLLKGQFNNFLLLSKYSSCFKGSSRQQAFCKVAVLKSIPKFTKALAMVPF